MQEENEKKEDNQEPSFAEEVIRQATENEAQGTQEGAEKAADGPAAVEQIELLQAQLAEQKDKFLRLYADFDNFKKRNARERLELIDTAARETIQSLLPVLDDFDRAMQSMEKATDLDSVKNGMQLIHHKMQHILTARGLKAMETKGQDFDTERHEAITEIPAPTPDLAGKVVDEVEKGYLLNEKIIRYAKVVVGKL